MTPGAPSLFISGFIAHCLNIFQGFLMIFDVFSRFFGFCRIRREKYSKIPHVKLVKIFFKVIYQFLRILQGFFKVLS